MHKLSIVHRDIRPDNIYFTDETEDADIRVGDFGVAKMEDEYSDIQFFHKYAHFSDKYFRSPEIKEYENGDCKTDVYSFGILILYMLGFCNTDWLAQHYQKDRYFNFHMYVEDCLRGHHYDFELGKKGIYISPTLKDLLKNMLEEEKEDRFTMA